MRGSRICLLLVLALIVSTLVLSVESAAQGGGKVMPHDQPADSAGGDVEALAYDSFNNPEYLYDPVQVPPTGVYYRQAGLNPDGTKIVAQKSWTDTASRTEIVLMNPDGSGEVVISPGDSGTGDIYGYMNPFWSDDGTVVGFCEVHNANPNKVMRYIIATATRDYLYQPVAPNDVRNPDFVGTSLTSIVFWQYGPVGGADLFIWDGSTLTNLTNSATYKEYEPVSNADGTMILYWSGETTAEPVNTTHTLTDVGGTWTKDVGFTPIADTYWSYWSGQDDGLIATTVMSTKDIFIYDDKGVFVEDLSGPGYSGGSGQWNFFGSMPEGPDGEWLVTSNAARGATAGRDIVMALPAVPNWTKYSGNPVVTGSMALDPSVIKDGDTYKMWYTHVDSAWSIYYAESSDGMAWVNKQQVLTKGASGSWEEDRIAGPAVIKDGLSSYKMWYMGRNATGKEEIGYATSTDGLSWTKHAGNPVLRVTAPGWDSLKVRDPMVILDGTTYKMWYAGCEIWPIFKIGYATSSDGIIWTKHVSNPIFTGIADGWDDFQVYAPSVVLDGGTYHMFYSGTDDDLSQVWSTGHATSADGITWTGAGRNPILIPDGLDSLDYVGALNDGGIWKIWYSYGGTYAIGLATLTADTQLWLDPGVGAIPGDDTTTRTYTVNIANALDLYGYQFVVTFDRNKVECTTAAFVGTFFPTDKSSAPAAWNATIDDANGKVYFARTLLYPEVAKNGSGALAIVTFRSRGGATGRYKLNFESVKLADIDSNVLPSTTMHAWLALTPTGTGTISGQADLQGRTTESGGTVIVSNAIGFYQTMSIANADGTWSMSGIPVGGYQVNVEMARYLDGQKGSSGSGVTVNSGSTTTLTKVKLLGGDANDDDLVDISDGAIIGGMFGQTSPSDARADINNDNVVDIMDLVLFGGNYTWTSPVPWS